MNFIYFNHTNILKMEAHLYDIDDCNWFKEKFTGDQLPPPRTQHIAISTPKHDKIFIFGGHTTPQIRLNDAWYLTVQNLSWKRADSEDAFTPRN